jgi:hypothetical protein
MIQQIFSRKVLLAGLLLGIFLVVASVVFILIVRPSDPQFSGKPLGAAMTVIPAPTATPRSLSATLTSLPPTPTTQPTPAPGEFATGVYVQVTIGEDALRVRVSPGLSADILFLALDAEVFLIEDGPIQADGYTWWYLTTPYARAGWAVQDFLTVIPSP